MNLTKFSFSQVAPGANNSVHQKENKGIAPGPQETVVSRAPLGDISSSVYANRNNSYSSLWDLVEAAFDVENSLENSDRDVIAAGDIHKVHNIAIDDAALPSWAYSPIDLEVPALPVSTHFGYDIVEADGWGTPLLTDGPGIPLTLEGKPISIADCEDCTVDMDGGNSKIDESFASEGDYFMVNISWPGYPWNTFPKLVIPLTNSFGIPMTRAWMAQMVAAEYHRLMTDLASGAIPGSDYVNADWRLAVSHYGPVSFQHIFTDGLFQDVQGIWQPRIYVRRGPSLPNGST